MSSLSVQGVGLVGVSPTSKEGLIGVFSVSSLSFVPAPFSLQLALVVA